MIDGLQLRNPRIQSGVSQPVSDLPSIWRAQTRVDAEFPSGAELEALHALATHPKKLVVERLDLRRRKQRKSRLTLILSAYFTGVEAEAP